MWRRVEYEEGKNGERRKRTDKDGGKDGRRKEGQRMTRYKRDNQ